MPRNSRAADVTLSPGEPSERAATATALHPSVADAVIRLLRLAKIQEEMQAAATQKTGQGETYFAAEDIRNETTL